MTNIISVRLYGEFEYWFAAIKVMAIIMFLIVGSAFVLGLWSGKTMNFENLTMHGGFAPNGIEPVIKGIAIIIFSFLGAEIVTITAAESKERREAVAKATRNRIMQGTKYTERDYAKALYIKNESISHFNDLLNEVDVIVTPTIPILPSNIGQEYTEINGK